MLPFSTAHPYELWWFWVSVVDLMLSGWLFTSKLAAMVRLIRKRQNGPMMFMAENNAFLQGILLAISSGMLHLSTSSINNMIEPTAQTLNLLAGWIYCAIGLLLFQLQTVRKRKILPELLDRYGGVPGGKRATDPPR